MRAVQATPHPPAGTSRDERLRDLLQTAETLVVSDAEQAERLLREAQALAIHLGDPSREALALTLLGATFYFRSQYDTALSILQQAHDLAERAQDRVIAARVANNMGLCAVALGHYGEGMEHYQKSLSLAGNHDHAGRARALSNMGLIHADLGDYPLALDMFQEVMTLIRRPELADLTLFSSSGTINLVRAYYHLGRLDEAMQLVTEHLPRVRAFGIRQHEVALRTWILACLIDTGRTSEVVTEAESLLPLAQDVDDREHLVYVRKLYGQALTQLRQHDAAQAQLELALRDAQQHNIRPQQRTVLYALSELHAAREDWQQAYEALRAHQNLSQLMHAEAVERKAQVLGAQMQMELLRRDADDERRKSTELTQANQALQEAQEALAYRATHDALTGLANRAHFQAEVERALQHPAGHTFAILFIDLDRFKHVNDTLGHDVGDDLLKEVARRLRQVVRAGDLVARMGGDEFTIILHHLRDGQDARRVAHKVLDQLAQPVQVGGHTLDITGSIGVALAPHDGTDVITLQKNADIAMYCAKREGKNGVRLYHAALGEETDDRAGLEGNV